MKKALRNHIFKGTLIALLFTHYYALKAQSPTCNINQIIQAFTSAGYTQLNVQGQSCSLYFYNNANQSANDAQTAARNLGANLVSIQSQTENDAIQQALIAAGFSNAIVWMGGGFQGSAHSPNDFVWYDGSPINYTNWNPGEPNNNSGGVGPENCMQMVVNSGRWNDLVCGAEPLGLGPRGTSVIEVNLCPEININGSSSPVCTGSQTTLNASTLFGSTPYTYSWFEFPNPTSIGSGASFTYTASNNAVLVAGVQDRYWCSDTAHFSITTQACPVISTCNVANIDAAMSGAGFQLLNVQNQPCARYYFNPNQTNSWTTAQNQAASVGASLVSITNQAENDALWQAALAAGVTGGLWIGYSDRVTEGTWRWEDGNTSTYTNWNAGEPNNSSCFGSNTGEDAAVIQMSNGRWNDVYLGPTGVCLNPASYASFVKVNTCPVVTASINPPLVCAGQQTSLSATTQFGSPNYTYSWNNITNASSAGSGSPLNITPSVSASYEVISSDRYNCQVRDTVSVTVLAGGTQSFTVAPVQVCVGNPVTVTYTGTSPSNATYNWNFGGGTVITGSGQGPYQVVYNNSGNIDVTLSVTESGCTSPQVSQPIVVNPSPVAAVSSSLPAVCAGDTVTLTASGGNSYVWSTGETTVTINVSPTINTTYIVAAISSSGCSDTASVDVSVSAAIILSLTNPVNPTCGASNGSITATLAGGTAPYTITVDNGVTQQTQNSPIAGTLPISNLPAATYTVTVVDAQGCQQSAQQTLTVPGGPSITSITPTAETCLGDADGTVTLVATGSATPLTYLWSNSATTQNLTALAPGNYTVTVTDANGCTVSSSATVNAGPQCCNLAFSATSVNPSCGGSDGSINLSIVSGSGNYTYLWSNTATTQNLSNISAGSYSVTVTDVTQNCNEDTTINLSSANAPVVNSIVPADETCLGAGDGTVSLDVTGGTGTLTFLWSNAATTQNLSALAPGNYDVTITDGAGCIATANTTVNPGPVCCTLVGTVDVLQPVCNTPGSITINIDTTTGTSPFEYSIDAGQNYTANNTFNSVAPGTYSVIARDAALCVFTQQVTVSASSVVTVNLGADEFLCAGENTVIDADNPGATYAWSNGETTQTLFSDTAGTYSVTVTDANGCTGTDDIIITTGEVFVDAGQDTTVLETESAQLNATISGTTTTGNFTWTPSQYLSCDDCQSPVTTPQETTTYTVTYFDNNGCTASDTVRIEFEPGEYYLYMPNAFTPNGDGNNDIVAPIFKGAKRLTFRIWDRWGELVFECTTQNCSWNGSFNGVLLEPGVFVWEAVVKYKKPSIVRYNGSLTLIR